jgi:hypothetical protein
MSDCVIAEVRRLATRQHRSSPVAAFSRAAFQLAGDWRARLCLPKTPKAAKSLEFLDSPTQYRRHAYARAIDCRPQKLNDTHAARAKRLYSW